jgi:hypothetical protein
MQVHSWRHVALAIVLGLGTGLAAQTAHKPVAKSSSWKSYCHPEHSFCFKYPADWTMLGEVFNGAGVVVAPPQKQERELWDSVTVALVIPPPQGDNEPVTIGDAIAQAVAGVSRSGQSFETEQRQQRTVNGNPAQMVKMHYTDQATARAWTEELVFIEGPNSEIYSVALKSATATLPRIEPVFARIVDSWNVPQPSPAPPVGDTGAAADKPKQSSPATKTVPKKPSSPPIS